MEIIKGLVGHTVKAFLQITEDDEQWIEGVLKDVDSDGILILDGTKLIYLKHFDYQQINVEQSKQNTEGIYSAFRQRKTKLFDIEN